MAHDLGRVKPPEKRCPSCRSVKPLTSFYRNRARRDGRSDQCADCCRTRRSDYGPEYRARMYRQWAHGLSEEQFNALREKQGGVCAVCGTEPDTFHVDHDHDTGHVRGLLCGLCNRGIGCLGDTAEGVERALRYLKEAVHAA